MVLRILRIYQAIIAACHQCGWKVDVCDNGHSNFIRVGEEDIGFTVREKTRREEFITSYGRMDTRLVPTGKLLLEILTYLGGVSIQTAWRDTDNQKIEDQLTGFIANVHTCAAVLVQKRIDAAEKERQKRFEEARRARAAKAQSVRQAYQKSRRTELAAKIEHENRRRKELGGLAGALHEAKIIRELVDRVRAGEAGGASEAWTNWASAVADMKDPFKNGKFKEMLNDPAIDASLDVNSDPARIEFPFPPEIEKRVAAILMEPLEKYIAEEVKPNFRWVKNHGFD